MTTDDYLNHFLSNSHLSDLGVIYRHARIVYLDGRLAKSGEVIHELRIRLRAARSHHRLCACQREQLRRQQQDRLEAILSDEAALIAATSSDGQLRTADGEPF